MATEKTKKAMSKYKDYDSAEEMLTDRKKKPEKKSTKKTVKYSKTALHDKEKQDSRILGKKKDKRI